MDAAYIEITKHCYRYQHFFNRFSHWPAHVAGSSCPKVLTSDYDGCCQNQNHLYHHHCNYHHYQLPLSLYHNFMKWSMAAVTSASWTVIIRRRRRRCNTKLKEGLEKIIRKNYHHTSAVKDILIVQRSRESVKRNISLSLEKYLKFYLAQFSRVTPTSYLEKESWAMEENRWRCQVLSGVTSTNRLADASSPHLRFLLGFVVFVVPIAPSCTFFSSFALCLTVYLPVYFYLFLC